MLYSETGVRCIQGEDGGQCERVRGRVSVERVTILRGIVINAIAPSESSYPLGIMVRNENICAPPCYPAPMIEVLQ